MINTATGAIAQRMDGYCYGDPINFVDRTGLDPGNEFATPEAAVQDALDYIQRKHAGENMEYGGFIRPGEEGFTYDEPQPGGPDWFHPGAPGPMDVAAFHSHGCEEPGGFLNMGWQQHEQFSGEDDLIPALTPTFAGLSLRPE